MGSSGFGADGSIVNVFRGDKAKDIQYKWNSKTGDGSEKDNAGGDREKKVFYVNWPEWIECQCQFTE